MAVARTAIEAAMRVLKIIIVRGCLIVRRTDEIPGVFNLTSEREKKKLQHLFLCLKTAGLTLRALGLYL
jgi:hypothetical protein